MNSPLRQLNCFFHTGTEMIVYLISIFVTVLISCGHDDEGADFACGNNDHCELVPLRPSGSGIENVMHTDDTININFIIYLVSPYLFGFGKLDRSAEVGLL